MTVMSCCKRYLHSRLDTWGIRGACFAFLARTTRLISSSRNTLMEPWRGWWNTPLWSLGQSNNYVQSDSTNARLSWRTSVFIVRFTWLLVPTTVHTVADNASTFDKSFIRGRYFYCIEMQKFVYLYQARQCYINQLARKIISSSKDFEIGSWW